MKIKPRKKSMRIPCKNLLRVTMDRDALFFKKNGFTTLLLYGLSREIPIFIN